MHLGEAIREARLKANMSQAQLAREMGFTGPDAGAPVCKWENGQHEPRMYNITRIAAVLKLPVERLLNGVKYFATPQPKAPKRRGVYKGRPKGAKNKP